MEAQNDPDRLEGLLAEALEAFDTSGAEGFDAFCHRHPDDAHALRIALGDLQRAGLAGSQVAGAPRHLGDFRILRRIGQGGMGIVFEAEQVSLGRRVALKVVRPELLFFPSARERFRREVEAIARLDHPAVVPVVSCGEEEGVPYLAMALLDGAGADRVIQHLQGQKPSRLQGSHLAAALAELSDGTCPVDDVSSGSRDSRVFQGTWWEACVRLFIPVADALHKAHRLGIVHRDIKPSNVILTPDGRALILDFGLAHVGGIAQVTGTGVQPGSPAYMSAEQVRGEVTDVRTDVYSLAATLHHLLALALPYPDANPEVLRQRILEGAPESLRARNESVPRDLELVLRCALDVDRTRRYPDMAAFAVDLEAVLERRPIRASPLPFRLRTLRFLQRHPVAATAAAGVLLLAVGLPTVMLLQQRGVNDRLAAEKAVAEHNLAAALQSIDRMMLQLGGKELRAVPKAQEVALRVLSDARGLLLGLRRENPSDLRLLRGEGVILERMGSTLRRLGREQEAIERLQEAVEVLRVCDPASDRAARGWLISCFGILASIHLDRREPAAARKQARAALDLLDAAAARSPRSPHEDYQSGAMLDVLARAAELEGRPAEWQRMLKEAIARVRSAREARPDDPTNAYSLALLYRNALRLHRQRKEWDRSMEYAREALQLLADVPQDLGIWPDASSVRADVLEGQALVYQERGDWAPSEPLLREVLAQRRAALDDDPLIPELRSRVGSAQHHLGNALYRQKKDAPAMELALAAAASQRAALRVVPEHAEWRQFLANHLFLVARCAQALDDVDALEKAAKDLGALRGPAGWPATAARLFLRAAERHRIAGHGTRRDACLQAALDALRECEVRGWSARQRIADPIYAPLRDRPEFKQLAARLAAANKGR